MMNKEKLLDFMKDKAESYIMLKAEKNQEGKALCPKCKKPLELSPEGFMCRSCGVSGDLIDYRSVADDLDTSEGYNASLIKLAEEYGLEADSSLIELAKAVAKGLIEKDTALSYIDNFNQKIIETIKNPPTPTGFRNLDRVLEGGIYPELYILGAVSSLGKSTFILQIADSIAEQNRPVIIFSLEMSRQELMAKSISRETYRYCLKEGTDTSHAQTIRGILSGDRHMNYSSVDEQVYEEAVKNYASYAKNIIINEGVGDIGVKEIKKYIKKYVAQTGTKPVVIIDYLQILAPYNERLSDKQNTDKAVLELKRLVRDEEVPVIAISSLNRASYNGLISMEAFKESGAIEYTSEVLIGLDFKGKEDKNFIFDVARDRNPREIQLFILKNRNGRTGQVINYEYNPLFNYWNEGNIESRKQLAEKAKAKPKAIVYNKDE